MDYYPADAEFEVWVNDEPTAVASGPRSQALREAAHYAAVYAKDGKVLVFEVKRTEIDVAAEVKRASVQ